jgi:Kef-type K+ transport system membrane component KefB
MNIFLQLSLILGLSSLFGVITYYAKLPLVIAYLFTGVLLAVFGLFNIYQVGIFTMLPDLGVAFVLFLVGMELDLRELKSLGKPIIVATFCQIAITTLAGFSIASLMGFSQQASWFLGIGLSFSSTVVIVQLLLEKKDLNSLYGKLSMGITLLEDLIAIVILMAISIGTATITPGLQENIPIITILLKGVLLFILTYVLSKYVLEKVFDHVAQSGELLFLTAITWCFLFTALSEYLGFSVTIGAFLAGVALASSPYHFQIQGKVKPLRDFFVTLFFVYLGSQVVPSDLLVVWPLVIIFTIFAVTLKPLIYLLLIGSFGFRKHTIFQTAINLAQVSEFSLIIILVGIKAGFVSSKELSVMAAVTVLSIVISSIGIAKSKQIFRHVSPFLPFFERKENIHYLEVKSEAELQDHIVLIGAHRIGGPIVEYLRDSKIPFIVMDFNPQVVEKMRKEGVFAVYGDIGDPDILDSLQLPDAKLIISTATDLNDNKILLNEVHSKKIHAPVVVRALDHIEARQLKKLGAEYIIMPEQVSGDFLVSQLKHHWPKVEFSGLS